MIRRNDVGVIDDTLALVLCGGHGKYECSVKENINGLGRLPERPSGTLQKTAVTLLYRFTH